MFRWRVGSWKWVGLTANRLCSTWEGWHPQEKPNSQRKSSTCSCSSWCLLLVAAPYYCPFNRKFMFKSIACSWQKRVTVLRPSISLCRGKCLPPASHMQAWKLYRSNHFKKYNGVWRQTIQAFGAETAIFSSLESTPRPTATTLATASCFKALNENSHDEQNLELWKKKTHT